MAELVAAVERPPRQNPRAAGHSVRELTAAKRRDGELRDRHEGGAVERPAERLGELAVGDGIGSCRVDRPGDLVVVQRPEQEADLVVDVDPGHELLAARDRAADPELERKEELLEQASVLGHHEAGSDDDDARHGPLRLALGALPVDGKLGGVALPGRGFLVEDLRAAVAVVADRGLSDEDARLAGHRVDSLQEVAGSGEAALTDPDLGLVGEPLVDLLADQVDHAVDALERLGRRSLGGRLPGVPAHRWVLGPGALGIPSQADDLVASGEQGVGEGRADQSAGSGDEHAHGAADASQTGSLGSRAMADSVRSAQPGEGHRLSEIYLSSGRAAWARHLSPVGLAGVSSPVEDWERWISDPDVMVLVAERRGGAAAGGGGGGGTGKGCGPARVAPRP